MSDEEIVVEARWIAVSSTRGLAPVSLASSKYFKAEPHTGLLSEFGIEQVFSVVPYLLTPAVGFHEWATQNFDSPGQGFDSTQRRTPYSATSLTKEISAIVTNVEASLFPGQISVQISAKMKLPWLGDFSTSVSPLLKLRSLKEIPLIKHLAVSTIALAHGQKKIDEVAINSTYFAFELTTPQTLAGFQASQESLQRPLTALLTGTTSPDALSNLLVEKVQRSSEEMNEKSNVERLILNRLGLVYVVPSSPYVGPHNARFQRSFKLAVLATYCLEFLRDRELFKQHELLQAHFVGAKIKNWVENPELIFDSSFSHTVTWRTLSEAMHLEQRLSLWQETLEPIDSHYKIEWESLSRSRWWAVPDLTSALKESRIRRDW